MRTWTSTVVIAALTLGLFAPTGASAKKKEFTDSFMIESCTWATEGVHPFFNLTPGYQLRLETDPNEKEYTVLLVTVLAETEVVNDITTRVLEERETVDGTLKEVSRNFFTICQENGSVFYHGEDVDNYDDTGMNVINHDGAWRAGVAGARAGVIMPGLPLLGARYFQEVAPDVALDRAEITSLTATIETPAGTFQNCLETKETTPLERGKSFKGYAPGIGLVRDDDLLLKQLP
jgi:hypothetical protein